MFGSAPSAVGRCVQVRAHAADNRTGSRATGYYDDELLETDDGWKIARRRFTLVLLQLVSDVTPLSPGGSS